MGFEVLAIAGAVASAAGTAVSAAGASGAAEADAARLQTSAVYARAKADETEVRMREELGGTLANIRAVRAAAGTSLDSPTQDALEEEQRRRAERDIKTQRANQEAEAKAAEDAAAAKRRGARMSLIAGGIGSIGSLSSGLSGAYKKS